MLTQVAGRAGRSPLGGQVILQTFQPEHYVIQRPRRHDYRAFYQQELDYRRSWATRRSPAWCAWNTATRLAEGGEAKRDALARTVAPLDPGEERRATELIGPAPCFFSRLAGLYRWQIVLRGPDPASLLRGKALEGGGLKLIRLPCYNGGGRSIDLNVRAQVCINTVKFLPGMMSIA